MYSYMWRDFYLVNIRLRICSSLGNSLPLVIMLSNWKTSCREHAPQHNSEEDLYVHRDASSLLPGLHQHQHYRLTEISKIVGLTILYALGWEHMCKILPVFYSSICCLFNPADFVGHLHVRFAYSLQSLGGN